MDWLHDRLYSTQVWVPQNYKDGAHHSSAVRSLVVKITGPVFIPWWPPGFVFLSLVTSFVASSHAPCFELWWGKGLLCIVFTCSITLRVLGVWILLYIAVLVYLSSFQLCSAQTFSYAYAHSMFNKNRDKGWLGVRNSTLLCSYLVVPCIETSILLKILTDILTHVQTCVYQALSLPVRAWGWGY